MTCPRSARALLLLVAAGAVAPRPAAAADAPGSKDPPMVQRMAGSSIHTYVAKAFDSYRSFCALPAATKDIDLATTPGIERLEGKVTRVRYMLPDGTSTLEGHRQYEASLKASGFTIAAAHDKDEIDAAWATPAVNQGEDWVRWPFGPGEPHYLCAKRSGPGGEVVVSVMTYKTDATYAQVDVVEIGAMKGRMIDPDASGMARGIRTAGHVALYGITFDSDSAQPRPESDATLAEIAKMLKADAKMKLYVVGHTDDQGGYDHNMDLSQRRAAAVSKALASGHGVEAARLKAVGVGPVAPAAPNDGDEGRAKNRRVELVRQ